jgi:hypothetical protein
MRPLSSDACIEHIPIDSRHDAMSSNYGGGASTNDEIYKSIGE